ncbi:MAG: hypothetical protein WD830_06360 [Chloroflexota bacterium]
MDLPIVRFAIGGLLGGLASLAISFGPFALIVVVALALLLGFASRSHAVVSGVLCGFGLTWLVLIGSGYTTCVSMGPNCSGSENMVPFLITAGVVFLAGLAVGLLGIVRDRDRDRDRGARHGAKGSAA